MPGCVLSPGPVTRRTFIKGVAGAGAVLGVGAAPAQAQVANSVVTENRLAGSTDFEPRRDDTIEGFTTDASVNRGQPIRFKIKTPSTRYRIDIYRIGWYGGRGARKVATVRPSVTLPQSQPAPLRNTTTYLADCGNWAESARWDVPATAVSGVYCALLRREDNADANHIYFVVREDGRTSDLLFQTADTTRQAYNIWGGASLYYGDVDRARKVSYNRPEQLSSAEKSFSNAENPMVRWLERNGYDVTYCTGVDSARYPANLLRHKIFLSVGHDEYWAGEQRANVEAARDAGVHLAFFSGNEVFWKTRWEPSIDSSATPHRTMVCYKETKEGAKTDPSPQWTGTWRDPRFSPPSDGGRPENGLVGQLFTVILYPGDYTQAIQVPYELRLMRLWRNTSVRNLTSGQKATFTLGSLGHEWGEDLDNGARPPGVIRLSKATYDVNELIRDFGNTFTPGTATHSLTLYRAPSGALVFGAGTIQYAYALDDDHSGGGGAPDVRLQQATLNLFADMGVQPGSRQSTLVAATASTDRTAPVAAVAAPAAGAGGITSGVPLVVSGTASDTGGGVVAGVELSVDGATWHPAVGRENWTYTFVPQAPGPITIRARAIDDSCNTQNPPASRAVIVAPRPMPATIWPSSTVPGQVDSNDGSAIELGVRVRADINGYINGVRFYKSAANAGTHRASLWTTAGALLSSAEFTAETASGWQEVAFPNQVPVVAGTTYIASYHAPRGHFSYDGGQFVQAGAGTWPIRALRDGVDGGNGLFRYSATPTFPTDTYGGSNYWVDVVFDDTDRKAPSAATLFPQAGEVGVIASTPVRATFDEAVDAATLVFTVRDPGGTAVAGSAALSADRRTATFTPATALAGSTAFTARVEVKDPTGNAMTPVTWSFTTRAAHERSLWDSTVAPGLPAVGEAAALELGVRFRSDVPGLITGVRFFKGPGNGGLHKGSIWNTAGTRLSTVDFAGETAGGWQQASITPPVAATANTTYVVSYHAPQGHYAFDAGYFVGADRDSAPLHAPRSAGDERNGVFRYGAASQFPDGSYNGGNYWVDVVFDPRDQAAPVVSARFPQSGELGVSVASPVRVTFSEPVVAGSIVLEVRTPQGSAVPGTVGYDAVSRTATFTPGAALSAATAYTTTVSGARDADGNVMATSSWTFTTAAAHERSLWDSTVVPGTTAADDSGPLELGVKFRADAAGYATGVRFYKGAGNGGTHRGNLWAADGTNLATLTFAGETEGGWQQASFATAVPIVAGTTYVVSYHAPQGRYAVDGGYFATDRVAAPLTAPSSATAGGNGLYGYGSGGFPTGSHNAGNYWVDVVFDNRS